MDTTANCTKNMTSYDELTQLNRDEIEAGAHKFAEELLPVMLASYSDHLGTIQDKIGAFIPGALLATPEMTETMPHELRELLAATAGPNDKIDMRMVADNIRAIGTLSETLATAIEAGIESAPEPPPFEEFAAGAADEPCHCDHATTAEEAN